MIIKNERILFFEQNNALKALGFNKLVNPISHQTPTERCSKSLISVLVHSNQRNNGIGNIFAESEPIQRCTFSPLHDTLRRRWWDDWRLVPSSTPISAAPGYNPATSVPCILRVYRRALSYVQILLEYYVTRVTRSTDLNTQNCITNFFRKF